MILVSFWRYLDPDLYRLKRIQPNATDPYGSGSGSTTLIQSLWFGSFKYSTILGQMNRYLIYIFFGLSYSLWNNGIVIHCCLVINGTDIVQQGSDRLSFFDNLLLSCMRALCQTSNIMLGKITQNIMWSKIFQHFQKKVYKGFTNFNVQTYVQASILVHCWLI